MAGPPGFYSIYLDDVYRISDMAPISDALAGAVAKGMKKGGQTDPSTLIPDNSGVSHFGMLLSPQRSRHRP
jgi:hypothetical protein